MPWYESQAGIGQTVKWTKKIDTRISKIVKLPKQAYNLSSSVNATVEYKNLYASALTNDGLSKLTGRIEDISKVLKEHESRMDLLVSMIFDICQSLEHYLGDTAYEKVEQMDPIADSLLRPPAPHAAPAAVDASAPLTISRC